MDFEPQLPNPPTETTFWHIMWLKVNLLEDLGSLPGFGPESALRKCFVVLRSLWILNEGYNIDLSD